MFYCIGGSSIKVIAGEKRGMNLYTLEGDNTRPTLTRVKETVFNIISFDLLDVSFLDLFAGSGAMGIEALSRGAKKGVFLDISKDAIDVINKNIKKAGYEDKSKIIKKSSLEFLIETQEKFDIIYIDPPYNMDLHNQALKIIFERKLLNSGGILIIEVASKDKVLEEYTVDFNLFRTKNFKTFDIYFYRNEN